MYNDQDVLLLSATPRRTHTAQTVLVCGRLTPRAGDRASDEFGRNVCALLMEITPTKRKIRSESIVKAERVSVTAITSRSIRPDLVGVNPDLPMSDHCIPTLKNVFKAARPLHRIRSVHTARSDGLLLCMDFYGAEMPFQCTQNHINLYIATNPSAPYAQIPMQWTRNLNLYLQINAVHPGYVATDMSSHKGPLSIDEGAAAPLWVALDADLRGAYVWCDSRVVDWDGEKPEG
ncbi:hypothetical protein MSG28_008432 [Choristoneura fumiferana]|uniref:Uncharacterized protein n=1 Tax=Choristoneura fumiferana TaxID=7141 RepID=A0ACC0J4L3_CHOFU|nr:hypothetical protein MSG28_008432 [Choristoneura fumiferana]